MITPSVIMTLIMNVKRFLMILHVNKIMSMQIIF